MKSGWVMKKLGEVCEVQLGKMLDKAKNKGKPYKYLANLSVRWRSFDLSNLRTMPFMDSEVEKFSLRPGDILMCEGGEPGRCAIWQIPDSDIKFQKAVHRIRSKGTIEPAYLVAYFESIVNTVEFNSRLTGATIKHLPRERLLEIPIPIPPLAEQKRIVAKIDAAFEKIDALKANAERNLANAKELFQSALDEAMRPKKGWVEKRLGEVCENITDGDHQPPPKVASGVPFLVISDVSKGHLSFEDTRFVSEEYYAKIPESKKPKIGDVLLTVTGSFGIPVLVDTEKRFCFQRHIALLRSNQMIPRFLVYQLSSHESFKYFDKVATGTAQRTVSLSSLRNMEIVAPPFAEQERIVEKIGGLKQKLDVLQHNYARQIADCAEMRQAILREAFEGRL